MWKHAVRRTIALAIATPLLLWDPSARAATDDSQTELEASYGCAIVGGVATLVGLGIGPGTVISALTGSATIASTPLLVTVGFGGITFGSFCLVGAAITPMAMDIAERLEQPVADLAASTSALAASTAAAAAGAVAAAPMIPGKIHEGAYAVIDGIHSGLTGAAGFYWQRFLVPAEELGTRTTHTLFRGCAQHRSCEWALEQWRGVAAFGGRAYEATATLGSRAYNATYAAGTRAYKATTSAGQRLMDRTRPAVPTPEDAPATLPVAPPGPSR